jgi:hypothetical protein
VFDSLDVGVQKIWEPASGATNNYVGYQFVNPVCVKKVRCLMQIDSNAQKPRTFVVQASNDNSLWTDIGEITINDSGWKNLYIDVENNSYYMYYRLFCAQQIHQSASWSYHFNTLQFYGRELKVSVPTMTSNTAPFGEASTDSVNANFPAWRAFRNKSDAVNDRAIWAPNDGSYPHSLMYEFVSPMAIKIFKYENAVDGQTYYPTSLSLYGSDGTNEYEKIADYAGSAGNNTKFIYSISDTPNKGCKKYKVTINSASGNYAVGISNVQFYGSDYSEKEIKAETNKK